MTATISIRRKTGLVSVAQVAAVVKSLQIQITRDFSPFWLADAKIVAGPKAGAWQVDLVEHVDLKGALGYHFTSNGRADGSPIAYVGIADNKKYKLDWRVTLSHEVLEMLANPTCNATMPYPDGRSVSMEIADPVQGDRNSYKVNGIPMSNFVTPSYFSGRGTRFDFKKQLKAPLELAPGGFMSVYDGKAWTQIVKKPATGEASRILVSDRHQRIVYN